MLDRRLARVAKRSERWRRLTLEAGIGLIALVIVASVIGQVAADRGLGRMSTWSLNRDQQCGVTFAVIGTHSNVCGGVAQRPLQFTKTSHRLLHGSVRAQAAVATAPDLLPEATTARREGGKVVWYQAVWVAKWYSQGQTPDIENVAASDSAWRLVGPVLRTDRAPRIPKLCPGTYPAWTSAKVFRAGDRALYEGLPYQTSWYTQGDVPATPARPARRRRGSRCTGSRGSRPFPESRTAWMWGMTASTAATAALRPDDFLNLDALLSDEERDIRDTVRSFVAKEVVPYVGDWFEQATIPRELAPALGRLGLLGMHLTGYGCAGASATAYGLACMELEAGDSGVRSLVSVQGSLAMYAIWRWGSEAQKQEWLPRMAAGEAIGCFGLTEPDAGSDPGSMRTRARRAPDGTDWILDGAKMWITNGSIADVAVVWAATDDGIRGFLVPRGTPGFSAPEIHKKLSLRASVTSELVFDDVRLPDSARLPEATSLRGPLSCLNEARYGIVWGSAGAGRACFEAALDYAKERIVFGKPIAATQIQQQKLAFMALEVNRASLVALHLGRMKDAGTLRPEHVSMGKLGNVNGALDVARAARQVLGANGVSLEYPVIRHMNNLESVVTYEGTADVHALVIGGALTGIQAFR